MKSKQIENKLHTKGKIIGAFSITFIAILILFFIAINTGGLKTTVNELWRGLFYEYNQTIAIIIELRFPRIIVALFVGALMSVSGVLMQSVMKNPLADPGIIGINSGAAFAVVIITTFAPSLGNMTAIFSFIGGIIAFILVYTLAWNGQISPVRLILVGIAVNAIFTGLYEVLGSVSGGNYSGAANLISANISLKTWDEVKILGLNTIIAIICCIFIAGKCNLLALSEQTIHGLGVNVGRTRIIVSIISVLLASIFTSVIGVVSFLGLIVPHIAG